MILLAIDAGLRHCGVAVYEGPPAPALVWAGLVGNPERTLRGPRAWKDMARAVREAYPLGATHAVIEMMQHDSRTRDVNAADVFEVNGVVGKLASIFSGSGIQMSLVTPGEWAGAVPKEVRHARLAERLTDEDRERIEDAGALTHNVLDAVDLGQWFFTQEALWMRSAG